MLHIPQLIIETLRAALASHWALASWLGLLLFGYTWTTKTDGVDSVAAAHINTLQTEKMDRDGQIPATGVQQWAMGADVTSAATLPLGSDGNYFNVVGTTTITAISQTAVGGSTVASGTFIRLHFNGILILTNGAALTLPGGVNITTYAGMELEFVRVAGGWRCTSPASGPVILSSTSGINATTVATTALYLAPAGKRLIPLFLIIRCTAFVAGSKSVQAVCQAGGFSPYNGLFPSRTCTIDYQTEAVSVPITTGTIWTFDNSLHITLSITTGSNATTETWAVDLIGYLF